MFFITEIENIWQVGEFIFYILMEVTSKENVINLSLFFYTSFVAEDKSLVLKRSRLGSSLFSLRTTTRLKRSKITNQGFCMFCKWHTKQTANRTIYKADGMKVIEYRPDDLRNVCGFFSLFIFHYFR